MSTAYSVSTCCVLRDVVKVATGIMHDHLQLLTRSMYQPLSACCDCLAQMMGISHGVHCNMQNAYLLQALLPASFHLLACYSDVLIDGNHGTAITSAVK